ncbi:MAG: DUF6084 family protein [Tepidisphaeraceae bacterium]
MPDLDFQVEGAEPVPYAASPLLALKLRVTNTVPNEAVHSVMLQCQIRLDVTCRRYTPEEQQRMRDLFGPPERWGHTLRSMLWTQTTALVAPFVGSTVVNMHVPCTFDFNVAAAKYFHGLDDGEAPLSLLFSGTVFFAGSEDHGSPLQVAQISWEKEATYRLPIKVWKSMMDLYYPNSAWLCLRQDVFDRLARHKSESGIPTWEQAIESLLEQAPERVTP